MPGRGPFLFLNLCYTTTIRHLALARCIPRPKAKSLNGWGHLQATLVVRDKPSTLSHHSGVTSHNGTGSSGVVGECIGTGNSPKFVL